MSIVHVARAPVAAFLSVMVCAAALAQSATPAGAASTLSVEDFIKRSDFSDVKLSTDGSYFAALMPDDEKPYENKIAIFDARTRTPVGMVDSSRAAMFYKYFWVSDERIVTSLAVRRSGFDQPALTGELVAFNQNGSGVTELFGGRSLNAGVRLLTRGEQAFPIGDGPAVRNNIPVLVRSYSSSGSADYTQAQLINIYAGNETPLMMSPTPNSTLFADHNGRPRIAISFYQNYRNTLWLYIPQQGKGDAQPTWLMGNMAALYHDNLATAAPKTFGNSGSWRIINDPNLSHIELVPLGFNRSNTGLYVRVEYGHQPSAIALYDLGKHSLTKLYQGKFASPGDLLATADGKDYYGVITQDGKKSVFYFDENSNEAKLNREVAARFPDQLVYISSFSRDGMHAIVTVASDRNPGDFYTFDVATHQVNLLMKTKAWIDPAQMRPMEPITLAARDGLTLHGFLTLPATAKPYPLVVLPHGGPIDVSDTWAFDAETQLLASRGYAVLQVNYRGSGGFGTWFQSLGYRQWGLSMQDDLTDATKWAITQGYADPQRICIYGGSYGGYAAIEGAVKEPNLYKCAIGYDGVYDLRVQHDKSDTEKSDAGQIYLAAALGDDQADLFNRSPLSGVSRITARILLIHGREDERVPYENLEEFTRALDKADKPYKTLVEKHEGHGFYLPKHQVEAYEKILEFLDQNIGPGRSAAGS